MPKCLDSVVNQTLKDIEIICINDGSTDNSLSILEEYAKKDSRIKIITQENLGVSEARNMGIRMASGEYISFIDSDDWIDDKFLEKLYFNAYKYDADIAVAGIKQYAQNKISKLFDVFFVKVYKKANDKFKVCDVPRFNYSCNKIYKRELLKVADLLFETGKVFEDIMFTHKILYFSKSIVTVPHCYYFYRVDNAKSITKQSIFKNRYKSDYSEAFKNALNFIVANKIKVKNVFPYVWDEDIQYTFFGIHIFRIRKIKSLIQYCLFKNIVFFERSVK